MEIRVDSEGRIVVPKAMREALGLVPGSIVDIAPHGPGLVIVPGGRTARLVEVDGVLVGTSDTAIDDDVVYAVIDARRK
jgi:AbrB family looped-hinge helix DNA binding protein